MDIGLEKYLTSGNLIDISDAHIQRSAYRPFVDKYTYFAKPITHRPYRNLEIFPDQAALNKTIMVSEGDRSVFCAMATRLLPNKDFVMPDAIQHIPLYRFDKYKDRYSNISDWGLRQFEKHYGKRAKITKDDIFHYVYGVLHDPVYREKYALNLKREFPRIPFYPDFRRWAEWGEALMALHIGYKEVEPWPLTRTDVPDEKARAAGLSPKALLKADRDAGLIRLDAETTLSGVPKEAWDYRLGNRSALDWILDQYKEKTPKDPTIRERFNTYRFADYKEKVVDLLMRVTRVSVETVAITEAMHGARRDEVAEVEPLADDAG